MMGYRHKFFWRVLRPTFLTLLLACFGLCYQTDVYAQTPTPGQCKVGDVYVTYTPTLTPTATNTPTITHTPQPTMTGTITPQPSPTSTATATVTPTATPLVEDYYWWEHLGAVMFDAPAGDVRLSDFEYWPAPCSVQGMAVVGVCQNRAWTQSGDWAGCEHRLSDVPYWHPGRYSNDWSRLGDYQYTVVQLVYGLRYDDGSLPVVPGQSGEVWWSRDYQGGEVLRWQGAITDYSDGRHDFRLSGDVYALCKGTRQVTPTPTATPDSLGLGGECATVDFVATVEAAGGMCYVVPTFAPDFLGEVDPPGLKFCEVPATDPVLLFGLRASDLVGIAAVVLGLVAFATSFRF